MSFVSPVIPKSLGSMLGKYFEHKCGFIAWSLMLPCYLFICTYKFCGSPGIRDSTDALPLLEILVFPFLKCTVIWRNCHRLLHEKVRAIFAIHIYGGVTMSFLKMLFPSLPPLNLGFVDYIICRNLVKNHHFPLG